MNDNSVIISGLGGADNSSLSDIITYGGREYNVSGGQIHGLHSARKIMAERFINDAETTHDQMTACVIYLFPFMVNNKSGEICSCFIYEQLLCELVMNFHPSLHEHQNPQIKKLYKSLEKWPDSRSKIAKIINGELAKLTINDLLEPDVPIVGGKIKSNSKSASQPAYWSILGLLKPANLDFSRVKEEFPNITTTFFLLPTFDKKKSIDEMKQYLDLLMRIEEAYVPAVYEYELAIIEILKSAR